MNSERNENCKNALCVVTLRSELNSRPAVFSGSVQTRGPDLTEGSGQGQDVHEPAAAKRQRLRGVGDPVLGRRWGRASPRDHCVPGLR